MKEIKAMTFTKLLCMLSDVITMPKNGMHVPSAKNPLIDCKQLTEREPFNFDVFK